MLQTLLPGTVISSSPLGQLIEMGGPVMGVLIMMALAGVITFVYLMLYGLLFAPRYSPGLRRAVQSWMQEGDQKVADNLRAHIKGFANLNPLNRLVLITMDGKLRGEPLDRIRDMVSRKAQPVLIAFEAPLKIIEVIAALAPLLGLLGTVLGMMEAFSTMAAAEGRANASQLSGGIYQALTTTAAGLIVAIPFAALAAWIEFRLRRLQGTLNAVLADTLSATIAEASPATELPAKQQDTGHKNASQSPANSKPSEETLANWQSHEAAANAVR